ncbi:hypothetical protein D9M70_544180 [compost metagenome]
MNDIGVPFLEKSTELHQGREIVGGRYWMDKRVEANNTHGLGDRNLQAGIVFVAVNQQDLMAVFHLSVAAGQRIFLRTCAIQAG